jgi:hypothetical protein
MISARTGSARAATRSGETCAPLSVSAPVIRSFTSPDAPSTTPESISSTAPVANGPAEGLVRISTRPGTAPAVRGAMAPP